MAIAIAIGATEMGSSARTGTAIVIVIVIVMEDDENGWSKTSTSSSGARTCLRRFASCDGLMTTTFASALPRPGGSASADLSSSAASAQTAANGQTEIAWRGEAVHASSCRTTDVLELPNRWRSGSAGGIAGRVRATRFASAKPSVGSGTLLRVDARLSS
jgi:hypothetical protein